MATKIAVSGPRFVAPDDMADVEFHAPSWDDVEPTEGDLLAPLPAEELEYFEQMKVRRAERESAKRAATRATVPSEFRIMADVAHRLTVEGATPPVVSMARDSAPVMTTGYRSHVELVTVSDGLFTVYGTTSVAEQYAGTAHAITDDRMARVSLDGDLYGTVRRVAPRRTANRRRSSVTVETGKDSRGKWARSQAARERADKAHSLLMRIGDESGHVYGSEVAELLGRPLTAGERKTLQRYNQRVAARAAGEHVPDVVRRESRHHGQGTAMMRMINSLERK